ncbi:MAG: methylenetetrahydrofolate reductase [NAD(P)H] [gamma proteobacterium endosymbiont of Lamellibrachia anaximandri]|nr:methylenetetrahydrofolate reductase [NAD(P)H] [gamma proteobacterium endosymbiont of Lamellibrachia anaximandri]MBL3533570.1 methylenetetrahydrofolate reductase [NAD(P)H] [gamma proteobacterium endosymbiont of Lamellibrachia anaximandri]MBL3598278.1 methylenetetrahydrofolate reductase [NAD(P)H] [gamma proteobacterium endosymbiont of Lamellibrachia anaximandri]
MTTNRSFSFELFPPKTEKGFENLKSGVNQLNALNPEFFSVTYGAGGSTQERTFSSVDWLREQQIETAPHLSCIGSSREEILQILDRYHEQKIRRLVALRGDLPSGAGLGSLGELNYANELVELIKERYGDHFYIEVAAYPEFHPQANNAQTDLKNFKRKVEAGADGAITQYFYNPDAYFCFVEECSDMGINIPIVPGIMPITNYVQLARFSDACGAEIPRWVRKRLESFADDMESIRAFGADVVTELCRRLLDGGAPGLHFYTMNQAAPTLKIWNNLGL